MNGTRSRKTVSRVVIGLSILLGLIAAGAGFYLYQMDQARRGLVDVILSNPESTALAVYTFDINGEMVEDAYAIFHNADQPLVMASTMKLVVLAAYANAVVEGALDPAEQVPVTDWEAAFLPVTDGGAHAGSLGSVGLQAGEHGFASDQSAAVRLEDIARTMIHYSDNTSTDYLLARLGPERIEAAMAAAGMERHTPVHSLLGLTLLFANHQQPVSTLAEIQPRIKALEEGDTSAIDRLAADYKGDPGWRAAQIHYLTANADPGVVDIAAVWPVQLEISRAWPKGTAREYAHLMALVASGRMVSPEVSAIMAQMLESVPSDEPLRLLYFDRFGAKDGVTAGVLTLASYAVPKSGPLAGQPRVAVILTNGLPYDPWITQVSYQGIYLLQTDLATASGEFGRLAAP